MAIDLNSVASAYPADTYTAQVNQKEEEQKAAAKEAAQKATEAAPAQKADGFEVPPYKPADTITGPLQNVKMVVGDKSEYKMTNLQNLAQAMFGQQGKVANTAYGKIFVIDKETQAAAKAAIAEDGYWGAEQTATRLLDFAKSLSGGDASKIEELREGVQKGYDAVAKMFGGKLPQVTIDTRDRVMQGFDDWAKEAAAAANPEATEPTDGTEATLGAE